MKREDIPSLLAEFGGIPVHQVEFIWKLARKSLAEEVSGIPPSQSQTVADVLNRMRDIAEQVPDETHSTEKK